MCVSSSFVDTFKPNTAKFQSKSSTNGYKLEFIVEEFEVPLDFPTPKIWVLKPLS
jgi:hypothetical protein